MSRRKRKDDGLGGECIVVLAGRAFRCVMTHATAEQHMTPISTTNHYGVEQMYQGSETWHITCEYDVLAEVSLTEVQQATIRRTVDAGTPKPLGRRAISFGKV